MKFLIKWKDHSEGETWETEFRTKQFCPELVPLYVQEMEMAQKKATEVKFLYFSFSLLLVTNTILMQVEAIVEHKTEYNKDKYLIKWKDHSKGETWETARKTISVCPDILAEFIKDVN